MHEKPAILEKFRDLVIKGEEEGWEDDDFWNVFKTQDKSEQPVEKLIQGVTNRPLILRRKQNTSTQMIDYTLTRDDCQRLLLEYPDLNSAYEQTVKIDPSTLEGRDEWKTNDEFWAEFLSKNLLYQTEPFGGNNPLFIPYRTEEKDYEDRYVHNLHMILDGHENKDELLRQAAATLDYGSLVNMQAEEGYGSLKSTIEMDPFFAKIDAVAQSSITQSDAEISKLDKLNAEQDIMAARIIQKINNNSARILKALPAKQPIPITQS